MRFFRTVSGWVNAGVLMLMAGEALAGDGNAIDGSEMLEINAEDPGSTVKKWLLIGGFFTGLVYIYRYRPAQAVGEIEEVGRPNVPI